MTDHEESKEQREHQELAVLVAYTEDDYIRANGSDHGSAQAVADAIQAAGYSKEPQLTEEDLHLLRMALQGAIGNSRATVRGPGYRVARKRSGEGTALTRSYRVLLEKLGGPKIPVAPVVPSESTESKTEAVAPPEESGSEEADAERIRARELRRSKESVRMSLLKQDADYRPRFKGATQKPGDSAEIVRRVDDVREHLEDVETAAEAPWTVLKQPSSDRLVKLAANPLEESLEDPWLEYGVASFGDIEDVILEPNVKRSTRAWTERAMQPKYGDLLVARPIALKELN